MRSINKVILIGNVTREPEIRKTPNGQNVATFGLATNREWVTRDKNRHNLAEFHNLVAWANLAEIVSKFVKKGKLLYIEGYLKTRNWESPEGGKKFKTEIVVQDLVILDRNSQNGEPDYIPEEEAPEMLAEISAEKETQEKPAKEAAPKESPTKKAATQEKPAKEAAPQENPGKKAAPKESPTKEAAPQENPEKKEEEKKKSSAPAALDIDSDLGL